MYAHFSKDYELMLSVYTIQIMMFRTRLLLGRMGMYDQYQDWRLDVDNMNYEVPLSTPTMCSRFKFSDRLTSLLSVHHLSTVQFDRSYWLSRTELGM